MEGKLTVRFRLGAWIVLAVAMLAVLAPGSAHALERTNLGPRDEATGLLILSPVRIENDIQPGVPSVHEVTLTNDSDQPIDVTLSTTDLGASSDPRSIAAKTEDSEFGAGDWLQPEIADLRLEPWEQVKLNVTIAPPTSPPVGTNLGAISVDTTVATGEPGTGDFESGSVRVESLIQVFLTVPGPITHDLRVKDVDVRDAFVLGNQRFVVWDVTFVNNGTVNEHVNGSVDVVSIFGNRAHTVKLDEYLVLRGAERTVRVIWNDLPWVGRFHPEVRVRGDDAKLVTATGESVTIFPWWLPVVVFLLIAAPALWLWWRRRQEWKYYLEDEDFDADAEWDDEHSMLSDR